MIDEDDRCLYTNGFVKDRFNVWIDIIFMTKKLCVLIMMPSIHVIVMWIDLCLLNPFIIHVQPRRSDF